MNTLKFFLLVIFSNRFSSHSQVKKMTNNTLSYQRQSRMVIGWWQVWVAVMLLLLGSISLAGAADTVTINPSGGTTPSDGLKIEVGPG
jgi:hypothetical protein